MILTWDGERKRMVYEGPDLGILYTVEGLKGVKGYWLPPEEEMPLPLGQWDTLEEAYDALAQVFLSLVAGDAVDAEPRDAAF